VAQFWRDSGFIAQQWYNLDKGGKMSDQATITRLQLPADSRVSMKIEINTEWY
jgi:hypothetical protein